MIVKLGIVQKLLIGILVPLILVLSVIGVLLGTRVSNTVEEMVRKNLTAETESAANQINAFFQKYFGVSEMLAQSRIVVDIVADTEKQQMADSAYYTDLLHELQGIQAYYGGEALSVWLTDIGGGEVLLSDGTHIFSRDVDFTTREWYPMVLQQQTTVVTSAYEDNTTGKMVVTVASPVIINNQVAAIVGADLDTERLSQSLSQIKVGDSGYVTLYDCNNTILYHPSADAVGVKVEEAGYSSNLSQALTQDQTVEGMSYTRSGGSYYGSTYYLSDLGYKMLGVLPAAEFDSHVASTIRLVLIGFIGCEVLLGAIITLLAISITRPLRRLSVVTDKLSNGELNVEYTVRGNDEISKVGRDVEQIVRRLKDYIKYIDEISRVLEQVGGGNLDFQLEHDYQGDFARVKRAMLLIQDHLSATMSGISDSAAKVNMEAEQISGGAQALAQGATEQASSVEELSAAVQDLNEQTTQGSNHAVEMSHGLNRVKEQVDASNEQMKSMVAAMGDITRQSNAIGKIIKTIDDIAFQTNILALNAAVEAARAGSAGKGFAVVADEVRSLAGKSADAARETNQLIARSMEAVKQGEDLAAATAQALAQAAKGADEIVDSINHIAEAYQDQARRLSEISTGVDQISSVVQTNSATAEQSAAASVELASQANAMRDQVAQFRLKAGVGEQFQVFQDQPAPQDPQAFQMMPTMEEDAAPAPMLEEEPPAPPSRTQFTTTSHFSASTPGEKY